MPEIPNVVPGEPVESTWGNDIRDRVVQKYADLTALVASRPFPELGELAWVTDPGQLLLFVSPGIWVPIDNSDEAEAKYVLKAGDVMTGGLVAPGLDSTTHITAVGDLTGAALEAGLGSIRTGVVSYKQLNGQHQAKHGYSSLSAEMPPGGGWLTIAEVEAWQPWAYNFTALGMFFMTNTDLQSYAGMRLVRRSDQSVRITSFASLGLTLTSAGTFRVPATIGKVDFLSAGDAFQLQVQRQGSGNQGTVRVQTMQVVMSPIIGVTGAGDVDFSGLS